ncbi:7414_t:CDS:2, partial [Funneliformis geosporum]
SFCSSLSASLIDMYCFSNQYLFEKEENFETNIPTKYACIIFHIQRGYETNLILPNFLCGWKQIIIESLETQKDKSKSKSEIFDRMDNSEITFEMILEDELLWCLSCIHYNQFNESYISQRNRKIESDTNFIFDLKKIEKKLVKRLVLGKAHFEMEDEGFFLRNFTFKHESFHNSLRILFDVKNILPQESIPEDKR